MDQPHSQKPRYESRPVGEDRQRKQPRSPQNFGTNYFLLMQSKEKHGRRVPLRLIEYRHQYQRGSVIHNVKKIDDGRKYSPEIIGAAAIRGCGAYPNLTRQP
jgi:hypothetical protein